MPLHFTIRDLLWLTVAATLDSANFVDENRSTDSEYACINEFDELAPFACGAIHC